MQKTVLLTDKGICVRLSYPTATLLVIQLLSYLHDSPCDGECLSFVRGFVSGINSAVINTRRFHPYAKFISFYFPSHSFESICAYVLEWSSYDDLLTSFFNGTYNE